ETVVDRASCVLVKHTLDIRWIEELVHTCIAVAQKPVHVVDTFTRKPAGVRRRESLLAPVGDFAGHEAAHRLPQDHLALSHRGQAVSQALPGLVFVDEWRTIEVLKLESRRHA